MQLSITKNIVRNTVFNIIGHFWGIIVGFLLIPYIIHYIGVQKFGIWAIVGVITGYFSLLDLGIGTPIVKYIAEFYTKREDLKINKLVNSGLVFYLGLSLFIIVIGFSFIQYILGFFNISPELEGDAIFALKIGLISFAIINISSVYRAIQVGLQRMDVSNKIDIVISGLNIIGTISFLELGYGFRGLMVNIALVTTVAGIVNLIIGYKIYPALNFNPFAIDKTIIKKLISFGTKLRVINIACLINDSLDKLLIGHFLLMGLVTFYELGQRVVYKARTFLAMFTSAVIPVASELDALQDERRLQELYIRGLKYLNFLLFPIMGFIFVIAPVFMLAWMGLGYTLSTRVIQILAVVMLLNIQTVMGYHIGIGIGKVEIQVKAYLLAMGLNFLFSIPLIIKYGFFGTVIGTAIALFIGSLLFIIRFNNFLKIPFNGFIKRTTIVPLIATLVSGIITYALLYILGLYSLSLSRLTNLCICGVSGLIFLGIYTLIVLKSNFLDDYDKAILKNLYKLAA